MFRTLFFLHTRSHSHSEAILREQNEETHNSQSHSVSHSDSNLGNIVNISGKREASLPRSERQYGLSRRTE